MSTISRDEYSEVLSVRIRSEVLDRCTSCGKCADVCPMVPAAEIQTNGVDLARGVLSILQGGAVQENSAKWIQACSSSGTCLSACEYGVDPMFMIEMSRIALLGRDEAKRVQTNATRSFLAMAKSVRYLSRLFLDPETLDRLSPKTRGTIEAAPDVVFYTGCNVLRTPHIALVCLDILDQLDIHYEVMGGPSHCCGAYQIREGDIGSASSMALNTIGKFIKSEVSEIVSWCPSCQLQFGHNHLPTYAAAMGSEQPFDFTPFYKYLARHLDKLVPLMTRSVAKTVMLDERAFDPDVTAAVKRILRAIPELVVVEANQKTIGMMRNMIPLKSVKDSSRDEAFAKATEAGVTTFATIYHACHRETVSYSDKVSFEIINAIELIADSLGIRYHDSYKQFQLLTDVSQFVEDRADLVTAHRLTLEEMHLVAAKEFEAHHQP